MRPPQSTTLTDRIARWTYPYTPVALATFLVGAVGGAIAAAATPPDALQAIAESFGNTNALPDRLTTWTIFRNNVIALGVLAVGAVTFGATTLFGLLLNGFVLGAVVAAGADRPLATVALIAPHGVFELGAFFVVSGVAYRVTWRLVSYLRGRHENAITRREIAEAAVITVGGVLVIALAAWIEANLTLPIARALVGEPLA